MQLVTQIYAQLSEKMKRSQKEGTKMLFYDLVNAIEDDSLEDVLAVVKEMIKLATNGDAQREELALSKLSTMLVTIIGEREED